MIPEIALRREEVRALCRRFGVRRLDLFGSAARDDFDPARSDLDFLYELEAKPPGGYADAFFGLKSHWRAFSAGRLTWSPRRRSETLISARASNNRKSRFMRRSADAYLRDIERAADLIAEFTAGKTLADYLNEPMLRAAVERQFEIVGEALAQLAKIDPTTVTRVRKYRRIIAFRNFLIHGYADVDNLLVWDIVQGMLPALREDVTALLRER